MKMMKPAGWAGVLGVFLGVTVHGGVQDRSDVPDVMTKTITEQLDDEIPGWTMVSAPACGPAGPASADIDSDKSLDVAMVVNTPGGEARIVVVLPRVVGGAVVHDLGPLAAVSGATHVVVVPLGTAVRDPGAMFDDYLSGPTFAAASCEKALTAFPWAGTGFRQRPLR
ncbi:MAG TPA: hypothetical protein PKW63_05810 [Vicinamibacterales bacterium]|nr:hypothetical protein [Acidobacteriota bacterium]HQX81253.1 hypothetical protein [Vicinamibacterales bacterium]